MATIAELKQKRAEEAAADESQRQAETAKQIERATNELMGALSDAGLTGYQLDVYGETPVARIEGFTISFRDASYWSDNYIRSLNWYVQYGRSVRVHRNFQIASQGRNALLDAMDEADELDRLDNRPYVERLLADIRAGGWDDNYAETDAEFAPWKEELTAAWDVWHAEQERKWAEANQPKPTLESLEARIAALELEAEWQSGVWSTGMPALVTKPLPAQSSAPGAELTISHDALLSIYVELSGLTADNSSEYVLGCVKRARATAAKLLDLPSE